MELENKNIIITGAGSDIGAAAARLFPYEGPTSSLVHVDGMSSRYWPTKSIKVLEDGPFS